MTSWDSSSLLLRKGCLKQEKKGIVQTSEETNLREEGTSNLLDHLGLLVLESGLFLSLSLHLALDPLITVHNTLLQSLLNLTNRTVRSLGY